MGPYGPLWAHMGSYPQARPDGHPWALVGQGGMLVFLDVTFVSVLVILFWVSLCILPSQVVTAGWAFGQIQVWHFLNISYFLIVLLRFYVLYGCLGCLANTCFGVLLNFPGHPGPIPNLPRDNISPKGIPHP